MTDEQAQFVIELGALCDRYKVELNATDDGEAYGMHSPLIEVEFSEPHAAYTMGYLSSDNFPTPETDR